MPNDSVTFFDHLQIARNSRGEYLVGPTSELARFAVFSPSGVFLRVVGEKGERPGAFGVLELAVPTQGDTVFAFDAVLKRLTVFSPSYEFVRIVSLPGRIQGAAAFDGALVVGHAVISTADRFGFPLHTISSLDGRIIHSFAESERSIMPGSDLMLFRLVERASPETVWSARIDRFEMEEWSTSGRLIRRLVRSPPWYPAWPETSPAPEYEERPRAWIRGLAVTDSGRLWVVSTRARSDWRADPAYAPAAVQKSRPIVRPQHLSRYLETVVELLDVRAGRLVATSILPGAYLGFAGQDLLFSQREVGGNREVIDVWQAQLVKP